MEQKLSLKEKTNANKQKAFFQFTIGVKQCVGLCNCISLHYVFKDVDLQTQVFFSFQTPIEVEPQLFHGLSQILPQHGIACFHTAIKSLNCGWKSTVECQLRRQRRGGEKYCMRLLDSESARSNLPKKRQEQAQGHNRHIQNRVR